MTPAALARSPAPLPASYSGWPMCINAPSFLDCSAVPELTVMTGMPLAMAPLMADCSTLKSEIVVTIPLGLDAVACSMMRAISAMSPVGGLRYWTVTPRSCSASLRAFLMTFHQVSESGEWLTKTKRSPAAWAVIANPANGNASATASRLLRISPVSPVFTLVPSLSTSTGVPRRLTNYH